MFFIPFSRWLLRINHKWYALIASVYGYQIYDILSHIFYIFQTYSSSIILWLWISQYVILMLHRWMYSEIWSAEEMRCTYVWSKGDSTRIWYLLPSFLPKPLYFLMSLLTQLCCSWFIPLKDLTVVMGCEAQFLQCFLDFSVVKFL